MHKAAVVILNWNGRNYLEKFLPGVISHTPDWASVVVADNCSTDGSVSFLRQNFPEVEVVENRKNYGFAAGYNHALKKVQATYFVLLNSDVEVTPGWLEPLVNALEIRDDLAAVQPKVRDFKNKDKFEYAGAAGGFMDDDYYAFCRGRIFADTEQDHGQYDTDCDIYWATGACLCIRADLFFKAGGFDDEFFAHMEEIDLCARLQNMGYAIGYVHSSTVYHVGGGTLNQSSPFKTYLNYRNNLALIVKNHFHSPLIPKILKRVLLDGLSGVQKLTRGDFANILAIIRAHFAFYAMLPSLLRKRKLIRQQQKNPKKGGFYEGSILWQYFARKKRKFSALQAVK